MSGEYEKPVQPGSPSQCVNIDYDDSHCAGMNQCCVGVHDFGLHGKCTSNVRYCRKLGNAWSPPRPLRPLPGEYLYTDAPGYATTGHFVENFGDWTPKFLDMECIMKNALFTFLFIAFMFMYTGQYLDAQEIVGISVVAAVLKCVLSTL